MKEGLVSVVIPSLLFTVFCAFMYIMFAIKLEDKAEEKTTESHAPQFMVRLYTTGMNWSA